MAERTFEDLGDDLTYMILQKLSGWELEDEIQGLASFASV
jgi:hypothetical protein